LEFYLRFCAEKHITDLRLGDFDHLMEYVGWLRQQKKRGSPPFAAPLLWNLRI